MTRTFAHVVCYSTMTNGVFDLQKSVSITEVVAILTRAKEQGLEQDGDKIITSPPKKPKAGELYLFLATDDAKQGNLKTI